MGISFRNWMKIGLIGLGLGSGCGPDATLPVTVSLAGSVQKGPFVLGSTVNVSPLDDTLNPTGQVFNTQTTDDLGQFRVDFSATGRVALEGNGFYYNEVVGALSSAQLTLRALYEIKTGGAQNAYVNLVTHLTFQRVKQLVSGGMATDAATTQAEEELRVALGIGTPGFLPKARGIDLNILGGDSDANAYLLTVSAVVAQAAADRLAAAGSGSIDATLQELLNTTALDLSADGSLQMPLRQTYLDAQKHVDVDQVTVALRARLTQIGSSATVPDLSRIIDSDADGIANAMDNCPYVANPMQESIPDGLCKLNTRRFEGPAGLLQGLIPVDLNGDKTYSILSVALRPSPATFVSKNDGMGVLGAPTAFTLPSPAGVSGTNNCCGTSLLDMNNDKKEDVLRIDSAGWMAVYPGDGMGGFGAPQTVNKLPTADMVDGRPFTTVGAFAAADFKKDGLVDLVGTFLGNSGSKIVLVTQQAGGQWGTPTIISSLVANVLSAADVNKDGNNDLLFVDGLINGFHLYVGKGDGLGGFAITSAVTFPANLQGPGMTVGDFNGDTFPDVLVSATSTSGAEKGIQVYLLCTGDGAGNFAAPVMMSVDLTMGNSVPIAADFTGSGRTSLLIHNSMSRSAQLWSYQTGKFVAGPVRPFIPFAPAFARDMDKNGKVDLVSAAPVSGTANQISIMFQQ